MNSKLGNILLGLAALLLASKAAAEPRQLLRGIAHQALFSVDFDGKQGVAVGAGGQIMASADAGQSWQPQKSPSPLSLLGVAVKGPRAIAVGQMGLLLVRDGQGPWRQLPSQTSERLMAVDMNARGLAVAVGSFGTVLRSADGGASWVKANPDWGPMFAADTATLGDDFHPHLYGVKVGEDGSVVMAGELSIVMRSAYAGEDWRLSFRGANAEGRADPSLFGLDIRGDGVGYAVGQSGLVLKTQDAGASWQPIHSGSNAILLSVKAGADRRVLITGMREMLQSENDGLSWRRLGGADLSTAWYSAIATPANAVLVVGQGGSILSVPD